MKQRIKIPLRHFFATPPTPCPYLAERSERKVVTLLAGDDPDRLHQALSEAGFRRSQDLAYRPACEACDACVAVRIPAHRFRPNRSMRRVAARNREIKVRELGPTAQLEHFELFHRYLVSRHADGGMADMSFADYRAMVEDSPVRTTLVEFREPDGRLLAVCLTDRMRDGLSLVYSFFEPRAARRSPGIYIILWHVARAKEIGTEYVYLGYWIADSPKMSYKARFRPLEALTPSGWTPFLPNGASPQPA